MISRSMIKMVGNSSRRMHRISKEKPLHWLRLWDLGFAIKFCMFKFTGKGLIRLRVKSV